MFIQELKLKGNKAQYQAIDEAIRTVQFVPNKVVRHWMDNYGARQKDLYRYNTQLREQYSFVKALNAHACQTANVAGLVRNGKLAKSINDAAWSSFRHWLEYFGQKYGKITVAVPPHYTSQSCSSCGRVVKTSLSQRTHQCQCGTVMCRDQNAAINLLKKGLATAGHSGSLELDSKNASGDSSSTLVGEILLEQGQSQNEESPSL